MKFEITIETDSIPNENLRRKIEKYLAKEVTYAELVNQIGDTGATNSILSLLIRFDQVNGAYLPLARPVKG